MPNSAAEVKKLFSVILVILLGLQSFYSLAIHGFYYVNKDYIAAVLCENKDKPQVQCKGKCFLKKRLKKVEEQERNHQPSVKGMELLVFLGTNPFAVQQPTVRETSRHYPAHKTNGYSFLFLPAPFRPPCC